MEAPDGGWGWAVVFGCFMVNSIMDGIMRSIWLFYKEFMENFDSDIGIMWLIGYIRFGLSLLAGPVASVLINRYGTRVVAITGAKIAAIGYFISSFADNIYVLLVFFGVFPGLGNALLFVSAMVSVAKYFSEIRTLAVGMAVCGSGIGIFAMEPFTIFLINKFTWRGALLIQSGILLNLISVGASFRPIHLSKKVVLAGDENEKIFDDATQYENMNHKPRSHNPRYQLAKRDCDVLCKNDIVFPSQTKSLSALNNSSENNLCKDSEILSQMSESNPTFEDYMSRSQSEDGREKTNKTGSIKTFYQRYIRARGLSSCSDPVFVLYVISNCCALAASQIIKTHFSNGLADSRILRKTAFWLSTVDNITTITTVGIGFVTAHKSINPSLVYGGSLLICGLITPFVGFFHDNGFLVGYSVIYGACMGIYFVLMFIVLVEFVGIDKLTNAFGLLLFFNGIVVIAGQIIDRFNDGTGSDATSFCIAGGLMVMSALTFFAAYACKQRRNKLNYNSDGQI